jgi:hypothetical protein
MPTGKMPLIDIWSRWGTDLLHDMVWRSKKDGRKDVDEQVNPSVGSPHFVAIAIIDSNKAVANAVADGCP